MLLENNPYPQDGRVRREATALTTAGFDVTVISQGAPGQPRVEVLEGVRVYRYPAPREARGALGYFFEYGYSMIAMALITAFVAIRGGFDVIHAHNPPDILVVVAAPYKLFGKKFVFDHHDLSPEMYDAQFGDRSNAIVRRALVIFEKLTFRLSDLVIATNLSYRTVALERGQVPPERVTVVRNGPDLDRVHPVAIDAELRARAATIIAYVGAMGHQDGVDYLVRALLHLRDDLNERDFLCVIIGEGVAVPGLKQLAADLGLDAQIWFTGRISDETLMRVLSTADICVDPDPSNPFNDRSTMIKMTEYLAMAKPVVAFDLPEHRFTADEAALYAEPNDELDFARKLQQLMRDSDLRERMGRLGRLRAESELEWRHQEANLVSAYEKLITGA